MYYNYACTEVEIIVLKKLILHVVRLGCVALFSIYYIVILKLYISFHYHLTIVYMLFRCNVPTLPILENFDFIMHANA